MPSGADGSPQPSRTPGASNAALPVLLQSAPRLVFVGIVPVWRPTPHRHCSTICQGINLEGCGAGGPSPTAAGSPVSRRDAGMLGVTEHPRAKPSLDCGSPLPLSCSQPAGANLPQTNHILPSAKQSPPGDVSLRSKLRRRKAAGGCRSPKCCAPKCPNRPNHKVRLHRTRCIDTEARIPMVV